MIILFILWIHSHVNTKQNCWKFYAIECLPASLYASVKFHFCRTHNARHRALFNSAPSVSSLALSHKQFNKRCPIISAWESKLYRNRLFVLFFSIEVFFHSCHVRNWNSIILSVFFMCPCFNASVKLKYSRANWHSICMVFTTCFFSLLSDVFCVISK